MPFHVRLKIFFQKHDPERLYIVKKIARNFAANEDDVMSRLEDIYATGGPSKLTTTAKPKTPSFNTPPSSNGKESQELSDKFDESADSEPVKKSKKKLILILIVTVAVLVGGYFGYSMFFSGSSNDTHDTEEVDHEIHATDSHQEIDVLSEESHDSHQEIVKPVEEKIIPNSDSNNIETVIDTLSVDEEEMIIESVEILNALGK
jgi:cytoskeletal protein RodZ